jgi:antitoxin component HigA of HigAB toxin-antitoxin module
MDATLILIDSEAELARAHALVDKLWNSNDPADIARLEAQACLIAAYEERKWPRRPASVDDLIRHLENDAGFLRRIEHARESLRAGRGIGLEDIEQE